MKRIRLAVMAVFLLAGCDKKVKPLPVEEEETVEEETLKLWIVEPGMDIEKARTMLPFPKTEVLYESPRFGTLHVLGDFERIGYPQDWLDGGYDTDAIIVEKSGRNGIYNYNGEEVSPADVNVHSTPYAQGIQPARLQNEDGSFSFVYGYVNTAANKGFYYSGRPSSAYRKGSSALPRRSIRRNHRFTAGCSNLMKAANCRPIRSCRSLI